MKLSDEQLQEAVDLVAAHGGNIALAARAAGLARTTLQSRLERAPRRNMPLHAKGGTPPPGYSLGKITTLYDGAGNVRQEWVHKNPDNLALEDFMAYVTETLEGFAPRALPVTAPQTANDELATVYVLADHHLGMFSWREETGDDYDLKIASKVLMSTASSLIQQAPNSSVGVILNLGDFFHADDDLARTPRSGNPLSVDNRHYKVMQVGVDLLVQMAYMALQRHERVIIRNVRGNHDPKTTMALALILSAWFRDEPRVEVDVTPDPFFWFPWGKTFVAAAHGDMVKPADFPGVMAAYKPELWGRTQYRYALFGHLHSKKKSPIGDEKSGVEWDVFQTLAAKNEWERGMGFASNRSMTAITYHKEQGEVFRHRANLPKGEANGR